MRTNVPTPVVAAGLGEGSISACRKTPHIVDPLSAAAASSLATSWADLHHQYCRI